MDSLYKKLSEETMVGPSLAKKIIDRLASRGLDPTMLRAVVHEIEEKIKEDAIKEKLNTSTPEVIDEAINEVIMDAIECVGMYSECMEFSEAISEDKKYEILTTAKQTDWRYGDFEYSKSDLEEMAKNFNNDVVGTEIPVDLNHDPEHIAYAWIKPGSMEVKESSKLDGQYSLYASLYKFTPEGKDLIENGKVRYFSLQIQNKFEKYIDKTEKKQYNFVIRALALTNMPVIKDMAPTLSEATNFLTTSNSMATIETLTAQLSEKETILSEKDRVLSEKETQIKTLSEQLAKVESEKRDIRLSEEVSTLFLSEDRTVGFKGGQKDKILAFVKTLSDDQVKEYIALHEEIITSVDTETHGDSSEGDATNTDPETAIDTKAKELSTRDGISYKDAMFRVLSENPELAKKVSEKEIV